MGAGKSTHSKTLATERRGVLIAEDNWLSAHYPGQIKTFEDYIKHARRIKPFLKEHVQRILSAGTDVIMDFPANTASQRAWFLQLSTESHCEHEMIYLNASDETCLSHIATRRTEQPARAAFDTEEVFHQVTRFFEPPREEEGLNITQID